QRRIGGALLALDHGRSGAMTLGCVPQERCDVVGCGVARPDCRRQEITLPWVTCVSRLCNEHTTQSPAHPFDACATVFWCGELLRRSGLVVAMSGGVDSSVCAALAAAAVGPRRVLGLGLPERESDGQSLTLAREWATQLGIGFVVEDISAILEACGCYARRDAAIQRLVPDYGQGWRCKLVLEGGGLDSERLHVCYVAVQPPGGAVRKVRLPAREFREIVAATNFKQRVRTMLEYHHADRLHYAVLGTPNRLEYDQGFFVKGGDGFADVKPIAHLYKSQVYQLAEHLGVPAAIRTRPPTTDTYS